MRPATGGGPPRYHEIMRAISDDISSGRVPVGTRLPTEQQENDSEEQQHHHHGPQGKPRRIGDALIHRPPL